MFIILKQCSEDMYLKDSHFRLDARAEINGEANTH